MNGDDRARAVAAVRAAFAVLRRHATPPVPWQTKPDGGLVTAADREVDDLLRQQVPLPGDGWLSEESADDGSRHRSRRVWVVDPLDGTRGFVAGRPEYSVAVALLVDGVPVLGVVGNPAVDGLVHGGPQLGVVVEGSLGVAKAPGPGPQLVVSRSEWKRGEWATLAARGIPLTPMGSVAWALALVAAGAADATWTRHPKHEWDVAAGAALVLGADGSVWLPQGRPLVWHGPRPRLPGFAAAGRGQRATVEDLLASG